MCAACSLKTTVRHAPTEVGRTHASSVMPVVRSSSAWSLMRTLSLVPSNVRPPPLRPAAVHVGPVSVPVWPCPLRSVSVVPLPSLNE